jgi:hypothetical protein
LFVATVAHYPYEWLSFVDREPVFTDVVEVRPWTEREIGALLEARMAQTGYRAVYDDLVVDAGEGADAHAQLVSTKAEYVRLLWDHAEGSPRVALDAWLRSLVPDSERTLRVRLFARPDVTVLDRLTEPEKFALACVLWHESATVEETATALGLPLDTCALALERLRAVDVVDAEERRYRIRTEWWSSAVRYLRRKHLIES